MCSRSGCSGRQFPHRRPAARAGVGTRRWLSRRLSALCTAALGGHLSGSTQAATARQQVDSGGEAQAGDTLAFEDSRGRLRVGTPQLHTLLSFPPEASSWWSVLHLSPQTSCLCPWRRRSDCRGGALMSRCKITRSRLPDDSWSAFHANAPDKEFE